MKNYATHVGIDVAKLTLDYCLLQEDQKPVQGQILNTQKSLKSFFSGTSAGFSFRTIIFLNKGEGGIDLFSG